MTVAPRLYNVFASPCSSSSRSPCDPEGGGDCDDRGESGACVFNETASGWNDMSVLVLHSYHYQNETTVYMGLGLEQ